MKRRTDRMMDKPITTILLVIIIAIFMMVAVACNQPIEEDEIETIKHWETSEYKVIPLMVVHEKPTLTETSVVDSFSSTTETELSTTETEAPVEKGEPMTLKAYAYCSCIQCCGKDDGITSTGTQATPGRTIAVDSSVIPYGSRVVIDGHTYIAEDCGGAIKGNTIDVFHATHEEALQWGIKYVEAVVYPPIEEG